MRLWSKGVNNARVGGRLRIKHVVLSGLIAVQSLLNLYCKCSTNTELILLSLWCPFFTLIQQSSKMVVEKDGLQTLDLYCAHKISKTSYSSPIMGIWPISNRSLLLLVTKENELQLFRTSGGFDLLATLPIHTSSTFLDKDLLVYFNALEERIEVLSSERRALIEIDNHLFLGLFDPSTSSSSSVHLAKKIKVEKNDKLGASRETWSHFILHLSLPSTTPQMEKKRQHLQISCDSTNANLITISYVWNSNLPLPTSLQTYCIAGAATKVTLKSAMYSAESRSVNLLFLKEQERNDSAHTHKNEGYLYLVSNSLSCLDDTTLLQTGSARRKQLCASFDQLVSAHKGLLVNIESLEAKVAHPFLSLLNRIFEENVSGHATTLLTWKSLLCTSDLPSAQALQMLKPSAGQLQKFSQALSTVHLCKIKEDLERVSECLDSLLSIHALADIWHDHHTHELVQFRRSFLLQKTHLLSSLSALASFLFFLVANLEAAAAFEAAISAADQKSLILQWTASSIKSLDSWLVALTESQFSKVVTESHEQLSNHIIPSLLTVRTDDLSTPGSALEFDNHARVSF